MTKKSDSHESKATTKPEKASPDLKPPEAPAPESSSTTPPDGAPAAGVADLLDPELPDNLDLEPEIDLGLEPDSDSVFPDNDADLERMVAEMLRSMSDDERARFRAVMLRALGAGESAPIDHALVEALDDNSFGPEMDAYEVVREGHYALDGSMYFLARGSVVRKATHVLDAIFASKQIILKPLAA